MQMTQDAIFYRGHQDRMDYKPVGAAVVSGQVVDIGERVGICTSPEGIADGALGALAVTGVFRLKKSGAGNDQIFNKDGQVYWDTVAKTAFNAPGSNRIFVGLADEEASYFRKFVCCDINKLPAQQVVHSMMNAGTTTTTTTTTT